MAVVVGVTVLLLAGCRGTEPENATNDVTASIPTLTVAPAPATKSAAMPIMTPTPETAPTATPIPTSAPVPTDTPTPPTSALTPESVDDFSDLYELLSSLDENTAASDILDVLAKSETACLRDEINGRGYQHLYDVGALSLANSLPFLLGSCIEPGRRTDIVIAVVEVSAGDLSDETGECIRAEVAGSNEDSPVHPSPYDNYVPSYQDCLDREQLIEISVSEIAWGFVKVSGDDKDCMRQAVAASFGAAESLGFDNPQYYIDMALAFRLAAIFGCLRTEQIAQFRGEPDTDADITFIECLRYLFTEQFPRLYNEAGANMFSIPPDISPEEWDALETFGNRFDECETDPPVYPTPGAPAPTLRPNG